MLNNFIFIKNGYSLFTNLVSFIIAILLYFIVSLTQKDFLLKLLEALQKPGSCRLCTALLTLVLLIIYFKFIQSQIRQAYLLIKMELQKTLITYFFYLIICTILTYGLLNITMPTCLSIARIWSCFLIVLLALTGIKWGVTTP